MRQRVLAQLLHWANANPPCERTSFYAVKEKLLAKYGTFRGHDMQEIRKECWGDRWWDWDGGDHTYVPCGPKCRRCGGSGVFDLRWVRLERWEWCGFAFHRPAGDTRKRPESVQIKGRIEHADYGRLSREAALWLYLLTGHWRLLWRTLRGSCSCGWYLWPLLNVQRVVMNVSRRLRWHRCSCGRRFPTWGSGWCICRRCRRTPAEVPF